MIRTEPNEKEKNVFDRFKQKAVEIVGNSEDLKKTLLRVQKKLDALEDDETLKGKVVAYVHLIVRMLSNSVNGHYPHIPWQTLVMIVAGLLYFVAPLDALPDFIPIVGLIDDATILVWLGKSFKDDLEKYKEWEKLNLSR